MSILRRHARPNPQTLTRRYNTRLSEDHAVQFEKLCRECNFTPSEAIRLLIVEELKRVRDEGEMMSREMRTYGDEEATESIQKKAYVSRPKRISTVGRFNTKPWQVDGYTACPVCQTWYSSKNFSRHAKEHGMTTQEIFQDEERRKIADEMVLEKN